MLNSTGIVHDSPLRPPPAVAADVAPSPPISASSSSSSLLRHCQSTFFQLRGDLQRRVRRLEQSMQSAIVQQQREYKQRRTSNHKQPPAAPASHPSLLPAPTPTHALLLLPSHAAQCDPHSDSISRLRGGDAAVPAARSSSGDMSPLFGEPATHSSKHKSHPHHPLHASSHAAPTLHAPLPLHPVPPSPPPSTALFSLQHPLWADMLGVCQSLQQCSEFVVRSYSSLWQSETHRLALADSLDPSSLAANASDVLQKQRQRLLNLDDPLNLADMLVEIIEEVQVVAQLAIMALAEAPGATPSPAAAAADATSSNTPPLPRHQHRSVSGGSQAPEASPNAMMQLSPSLLSEQSIHSEGSPSPSPPANKYTQSSRTTPPNETQQSDGSGVSSGSASRATPPRGIFLGRDTSGGSSGGGGKDSNGVVQSSASKSRDDRQDRRSPEDAGDNSSGSSGDQRSETPPSPCLPSHNLTCDICEAHASCPVLLTGCAHSFCLACILTHPAFGSACPACTQGRPLTLAHTKLSLDTMLFEAGITRWEEVAPTDANSSGNSSSNNSGGGANGAGAMAIDAPADRTSPDPSLALTSSSSSSSSATASARPSSSSSFFSSDTGSSVTSSTTFTVAQIVDSLRKQAILARAEQQANGSAASAVSSSDQHRSNASSASANNMQEDQQQQRSQAASQSETQRQTGQAPQQQQRQQSTGSGPLVEQMLTSARHHRHRASINSKNGSSTSSSQQQQTHLSSSHQQPQQQDQSAQRRQSSDAQAVTSGSSGTSSTGGSSSSSVRSSSMHKKRSHHAPNAAAAAAALPPPIVVPLADAPAADGAADMADDTSPDGFVQPSSCHQCKVSKIASQLRFCSNSTKAPRSIPAARGGVKLKKACQKKYCFLCMQRLYGEEATSPESVTPQAAKEWTCPSCRSICSCATCCRKAGKKTATAEAKGQRQVERAALNAAGAAIGKKEKKQRQQQQQQQQQQQPQSQQSPQLQQAPPPLRHRQVSSSSSSASHSGSSAALSSEESGSTLAAHVRRALQSGGGGATPLLSLSSTVAAPLPPGTQLQNSTFSYEAMRSHNHAYSSTGGAQAQKHGGQQSRFHHHARAQPYGAGGDQPSPNANNSVQAHASALHKQTTVQHEQLLRSRGMMESTRPPPSASAATPAQQPHHHHVRDGHPPLARSHVSRFKQNNAAVAHHHHHSSIGAAGGGGGHGGSSGSSSGHDSTPSKSSSGQSDPLSVRSMVGNDDRQISERMQLQEALEQELRLQQQQHEQQQQLQILQQQPSPPAGSSHSILQGSPPAARVSDANSGGANGDCVPELTPDYLATTSAWGAPQSGGGGGSSGSASQTGALMARLREEASERASLRAAERTQGHRARLEAERHAQIAERAAASAASGTAAFDESMMQSDRQQQHIGGPELISQVHVPSSAADPSPEIAASRRLEIGLGGGGGGGGGSTSGGGGGGGGSTGGGSGRGGGGSASDPAIAAIASPRASGSQGSQAASVDWAAVQRILAGNSNSLDGGEFTTFDGGSIHRHNHRHQHNSMMLQQQRQQESDSPDPGSFHLHHHHRSPQIFSRHLSHDMNWTDHHGGGGGGGAGSGSGGGSGSDDKQGGSGSNEEDRGRGGRGNGSSSDDSQRIKVHSHSGGGERRSASASRSASGGSGSGGSGSGSGSDQDRGRSHSQETSPEQSQTQQQPRMDKVAAQDRLLQRHWDSHDLSSHALAAAGSSSSAASSSSSSFASHLVPALGSGGLGHHMLHSGFPPHHLLQHPLHAHGHVFGPSQFSAAPPLTTSFFTPFNHSSTMPIATPEGSSGNESSNESSDGESKPWQQKQSAGAAGNNGAGSWSRNTLMHPIATAAPAATASSAIPAVAHGSEDVDMASASSSLPHPAPVLAPASLHLNGVSNGGPLALLSPSIASLQSYSFPASLSGSAFNTTVPAGVGGGVGIGGVSGAAVTYWAPLSSSSSSSLGSSTSPPHSAQLPLSQAMHLAAVPSSSTTLTSTASAIATHAAATFTSR